MENPEKLVTQGTQDEKKTTTQYVLDTTIHKQSQTTKFCLHIENNYFLFMFRHI